MSFNFVNPLTINGNEQKNASFQFYNKNTFLLAGKYTPEYQNVTVSGNDYVNLPNAKAKGLNYLKLYGGCEQSLIVPEGYTRIASFTSTSTTTANINTGIGYSENLKIECTVKDNSWGSYAGYFRLYETETKKAFRLIYASSENGKGWFTSGGCTAGTSSSATDLVSGTKYHIILDKEGLTTNNTYSPRGGTPSGDAPSTATLLLCMATSSTRQLTWYDRCTIWDNTTIVFDGYTAKRDSDDAVGFYDIITKTFFETPGTAGMAAPCPDLPIPIVCNNGELKSSSGQIYADGTTETIKDSLNNTATAQNLFSVGNYKDVQEVISGSVTRNVGKKAFDGTETNWVFDPNYNRFYININGLRSSGNRKTTIFCTHYQCIDDGRAFSSVPNDAFYTYTADSNVVYFHLSEFSTINDLKTYLAQQYANGTPVIIVFPLATPTIETVTPQTLTTIKGANTIEITQASIDPLKLEAQYKAGIEVTITEVQNANLDNSVVVTIGE